MSESLANLSKGVENSDNSWVEITSFPYTAPYDMDGRFRGQVRNQGIYYLYLTVNGTVDTCAFSGSTNAGFQVAHYFKLHKGDVINAIWGTDNMTNSYLEVSVKS